MYPNLYFVRQDCMFLANCDEMFTPNVNNYDLQMYCNYQYEALTKEVTWRVFIPGTLGTCFHYWCSVSGICKWSDTLWPVGRVRLFADYTISLSSLCRLIWKHWTTKMLVRYMMPSVCLRLRQFSQLSLYSLYGAVCLQLTQFSCDDRDNVYFILLSSSNRKYESLTIV